MYILNSMNNAATIIKHASTGRILGAVAACDTGYAYTTLRGTTQGSAATHAAATERVCLGQVPSANPADGWVTLHAR